MKLNTIEKIIISKRIIGTINIAPMEERAKRLEVTNITKIRRIPINKVYIVSLVPNSSVAFQEHLIDSIGPLFSSEI